MTEPVDNNRQDRGAGTFSTKDNQIVGWFDGLKGDELGQTIARIPREQYRDQTERLTREDWDPNVVLGKDDRKMVLLSRSPDDSSFGLRALERALKRPVLDEQTRSLKVFYPRFDHDGNLDIAKSSILLFSRAQLNSLQAVIDNFGART